MPIFTQPSTTQNRTRRPNSLPIHQKKLRKSEEKIVGENEVLFDLFYCPSVRCGGMGMDWVVWAVGYLVG